MTMTSWQFVRVFAGTVVLASLALGVPGSPVFHSTNWLWLTAFAGLNLFQSGITKWCLVESVLRRFGMRPGEA